MANIIKNNQLITELEIESKLNILVESQTNNSKQLKAIRDDLQKGFIGLALRNQELLELNKELNQQMEEFLNSDKIKNIIDNSVSKEQAQQKITNFINK